MCDENHPFVLPKRFFVRRTKLAESILLEKNTLADTRCFPGTPRALAGLLSKELAEGDVFETQAVRPQLFSRQC